MKTIKTEIIGTKLHYLFSLVLCTLLFTAVTTAQVKFETRVQNKKVGKGDPFRVEYAIENAEEITSFQEPDFPEFTVLQGPSQGSTTSIMNGKVSQLVYVSYVIQAKKTGRFTISGASAVIGGRKMRSQNIQIEVVPGSTGRPPVTSVVPSPPPGWGEERPASKELYLKEGDNPLDKIRDNLFVKANCDRYQCYVGEPVVATYKLYTRLQSESRVTKRPSLNGFSVYDMLDPESAVAKSESLNGKDYKVYYIRKTQLYPLQPGKITLEPVEVENKVLFYKSVDRQRPGRAMDDLVREFFNDVPMGDAEEHTLSLSSKPMEVTVLPLPEEKKPANFNGAVGKFTLHATVSSQGIATGKSGELIITVEGAGNFPMITAPAVQWPASFEAYDPTVSEHFSKTDAPLSGNKEFKYVFTPSDTGMFTIPAVQLSYFDPKDKQYHTVESSPLSLDISRGADYGKKTTQEKDKTEGSGGLESSDVIKILMGATVLLLLVIGFVSWRSRKKLKQPVMRNKSAPVAETVLPVVPTPEPVLPKEEISIPWVSMEEMIFNGDSRGFYQTLGNNMWLFFSQKLALTGSERNKKFLVQKLGEAGASEDDITLATKLLGDCELALYTPVHSEADMQGMLRDAKQLVGNLHSKP